MGNMKRTGHPTKKSIIIVKLMKKVPLSVNLTEFEKILKKYQRMNTSQLEKLI